MAQGDSKFSPAINLDGDGTVYNEGLDGDFNPSIVTNQPQGNDLKIYEFDELSKQKIKNLQSTHKRPKRLISSVNDTTLNVARATEARRQTLRGGMTYDQFLAELLYGDEDRLLRGQFLYYNQVSFEYEDSETAVKQKKKPMSEGRVVLTDHRLIFLSSEEMQYSKFDRAYKPKPKKKTTKQRKQEERNDPKLAAVGNDLTTVDVTRAYSGLQEITPYVVGGSLASLQKSKYYAVSGHARDVLQYFSIPLGCIKNVELDADMGASSMTILKGKKPCWCCSILGFCGCNPCLKDWKIDWSGTSIDQFGNKRVLSLGVLLPPWGQKCYVEISLHQCQNNEIVRDIIADLQRYAPDLYTGKMEKKG